MGAGGSTWIQGILGGRPPPHFVSVAQAVVVAVVVEGVGAGVVDLYAVVQAVGVGVGVEGVGVVVVDLLAVGQTVAVAVGGVVAGGGAGPQEKQPEKGCANAGHC